MGTMASQIISLTSVYSRPFIQAQIKENTGEFHTQTASNAENVSIWWRHHAESSTLLYIAWFCPLLVQARNLVEILQSDRSPKVVTLFSATNFSSLYYRNASTAWQKFKLNEIMHESI